jgi:hypothetical protein
MRIRLMLDVLLERLIIMDWKKIIEEVIPVAASMTGNANVDSAAKMLTDAVDAHLTNQAATTGQTRDELLQQYKAQWQKNVDDADALLREGHEQS